MARRNLLNWGMGLLTVLLTWHTAPGAERPVWQIGIPDHAYAEFAVAGNYQAYEGKFGGKPVVYEVGRSEPGTDWPYIQPGPMDAWANRPGEPRTIRFYLAEEPRGVFRLRIEFVDVHSSAPPRYAVSLGGATSQYQLMAGAGDGSLSNARLGKAQKVELIMPAGMFRKGMNEIRMACVEGSWVEYDAVTLANDPEGAMPAAEIDGIQVRPTPFFVRRNGQVRRAVDVGVTLSAPAAELKMKVEMGGEKVELPIRQLPQAGATLEEIGLPDSPEAMDVKVTATAGSRSKTATVRVLPQRKWRVFVAPSSHTDIGYTDVQPVCAERHCRNADTAVELCRRYADFAWNMEVAWQAENYMKTRQGELLSDFIRFARQGRIGVQALYCNMLTGLCSPEEACRLTWYAHRLCREKGIPYGSAMISDVPTQEASLPMILASSGIRYFSSGINNDRAYPFTEMQKRCPCWWEGPDGSRILMMYMHGYAHASAWGLDTSVEAARPRVLEALAGYEGRKDYPYDAVFLHGAVSDNCPLNARLAEVARQWNERYEYPKIVLSPNEAFFRYIEGRYGDQLPVWRGSAGTYWEDGAGSSARETALVRGAHEAVGTGESLLALAERIAPAGRYRREAIYQVWRNAMLYDEHTWGAYCSISQPESQFTRDQWKIKSQFARDAAQGAKAVLSQGLAGLAGLVRTEGPALVVFNPSSWARTDVLHLALPDGMVVADPEVFACESPEGTLLLVKDVPACGYRVVKLAAGRTAARFEPAEGRAIESRSYRVEFDAASGGITSIRDKERGRELVDGGAPYRLNQYVYVAGGGGSRIVSNPNGPEPKLSITGSGKATLRRHRLDRIGEMMLAETSAPMTPAIRSAVIVWDDVKRIDIVNRVTKKLTYDKEGVYFAFPWALEEPTFRYEAPAAIVNANRDMLPGACLEWFTAQHFVEVEGRDASIAWATPDAPLVCFQDLFRGKWRSEIPLRSGHLYSYAMNNYWHTNYLAGQEGEFTFRYSITSGAKSDPVASARFGWGVSNPLLCAAVQANPRGPLGSEAMSLVSVAEPGVIVIGVKLADEGAGLVIRLWELSGRGTTVHVKLAPEVPASKAEACNLVEEPGRALDVRDGIVTVPIRGHGLATVRIQ